MEQEKIKRVLDDLRGEQFKELKFYLKGFSAEDEKSGGNPKISANALERANNTSDLTLLLVEHYSGRAVEVLLVLLRKVRCLDLAEHLEKWTADQSSPAKKSATDSNSEKKMKGAEGGFDSNICNLDCYDMKKKRVAFMMCVTEGREGAEKDIEIINGWFKEKFKFEFLLEECRNPRREELIEKLKTFQQHIKKSTEEISCCLITLMSHGKANGYILDKENKEISLEEIFSLFNNEECPKLQGKPKIFIIQACRGGERDYGVVLADDKPMEPDERPIQKLPTASDYFIVYSSQKGYVSLRSEETGSVMMTAMHVVFSEHGTQWHIGDLFTKVNSKMVKGNFQMEDGKIVKVTVVMESTLTKAIYLSPN